MGKSSSTRERVFFDMTTPLFPSSPEETDPRLLEALASLNQISNAINRIGSDDADQNDELAADRGERHSRGPGSSAVIYTYDQKTGMFENESARLGRTGWKNISPSRTCDAPRPHGIGLRTIQRRRRCLSYEEPDLNVHPYHAALGVKAVACFPLIVAEQAVGLLYIYLHEERQFTHLEQLMLDNFVNQAAMAIYHARRLAGSAT